MAELAQERQTMSMTLEKTRDRLFSSRISEEEARIRRDLAACYRLVALHGWEDMLATHISARLPQDDGKECFLISCSTRSRLRA
jgi:hypothetical protein